MNTKEQELSPQQLADIIFQRPDRLTEGILDRRSAGEKLRDQILIHTNRSNIVKEPGPLEKRLSKIFLQFNEFAGALTEHPRSLRRAALELKALGFSPTQINDIKKWVYRFNLVYLEATSLASEVKKDLPGLSGTNIDDRAFLGTVAYEDSGGRGGAPGPAKNSVYTERTEPMALKLFVRYLHVLMTRHAAMPGDGKPGLRAA